MRLIRLRALPLLQILYVRTEIPLELRTPKCGYDGIGLIFIGEIAAGRVIHLCHAHTFVTMPPATDLVTRRATMIWASVNRLFRIPSLLSPERLASPQFPVKT